MKTSAILIAAALGAVATPVFAASLGDQPQVKAKYDAKLGKYCVSQQITGQLIPVKDCRTKDEWAKAGANSGQQADAKKMRDKLAQN